MILSFGDAATADIYNGVDSKRARRRLPVELWSLGRRKLDMLNAAQNLEDLKVPPGNHLEKLQGNLRDRWSIRINEKYRVVFKFSKGNAELVSIMDYH